MSINAQPFQPQFKLIGNLAEDQVLVYDTSEGAFVNSTASGGGGASGNEGHDGFIALIAVTLSPSDLMGSKVTAGTEEFLDMS